MSKFLTNRWAHIFVLSTVLLLACWLLKAEPSFLKRVQYQTFDQLNQIHPREKSGDVIIIDVDEESLFKVGQWPWPRDQMARFIKNLNALGAKVIAFDMVFAEEDRASPSHVVSHIPENEKHQTTIDWFNSLPDYDELFGDAIKEAGNIVTGFTGARKMETRRAPHKAKALTNNIGDDYELFIKSVYKSPGVATNLPIFTRGAAGNGSFMATPDIDGIIRQVPLYIHYKPENSDQADVYPALALETFRVSKNKIAPLKLRKNNVKEYSTAYMFEFGKFKIPTELNAKFWVYYRNIDREEEYVPAWQIYDSDYMPDLKQALQSKLQGKIIFIGSSAEGLKDIRSTPLSVFIPGVEVHANIVEQILQGKYLTRSDFIEWIELLVLFVMGVLIIFLAPIIHVLWLAALTSIMISSLFVSSNFLYTGSGILFDPLYPAFVLFILFVSSTFLSYMKAEAERKQVREAFGLYISPAFMKELTQDPDKLKLGGEVRDLTVLFSDIRSFTTISESLSPEELIQLMNDFLTPMSDLVMENRGTIDKYMGDAMMAFWNAPLDDPDHGRNACLAALRMNEALVPVNELVEREAREEGREPVLLNAGIGINTGPCSVGNMGSRQRFAYSALGDAVNLASRLEGQTKSYGVNILLGEETQKLVTDMATVELDLLQVKGKEQPVRVYTLIGDQALAQDERFQAWLRAHNGMLAAYRAADFGCAAQDLKEAQEAANGQLKDYYKLYEQRIIDLTHNPPANDWDGVFVAKTK